MNLFHAIKAEGIPFDHHESDLYLPDTPRVRELIRLCDAQNATSFVNQAPPHVGERWIDVPFAYLPWWEARFNKKFFGPGGGQ